jgi:hypothetical protein
MEEIFLTAAKGLLASGPLAAGLLFALRYQTTKLEKAEARIEDLHKEKAVLFEKVFGLMKDIGGKS